MSAKPEWNWQAVPLELAEHLTSPEQKEVFALLTDGMPAGRIGKHRGTSDRTTAMAVKNIKANIRAAGYDPLNGMTLVSPNPQVLKGRSALVRIDPNTGQEVVIQYWNKTDSKTGEQIEKLTKFADKLAEGVKPAKPVPAPKTIKHDPQLMSGIFIGDAHVGLYAYAPETRHSNFDTDTAVAGLRAAIDNLVDRSPPSEIGLLVDVGDFMHADTSHNKTFAGTEVDVDTRYERILDAAAGVMAYAIHRMLGKFKRVIVVIAKGNHNPNAAVAVQKIVSAHYRNESRVDVLRTASFFHYIEWGKWLIGVNHGDKIKPQKLVNVMARDMAEAWGRTNSRMWALGHFHHQNVLELDGCIVQKFAALPPPDGWHSSMGYSSGQAMQMIVFKKGGGRESTLIYELPKPAAKPDLRVA